MKPIHLNLASRPYRDYRPLYAVVVAMSLVTAFLMLNNVETFYRYTRDTRSTRARIARLESDARVERERTAAVRTRLAGLDLAGLDSRVRFINARLAERAFSWSTLLDELESVLPDDVRLVSVSPAFDPQGTIALQLALQSKSAEGMIRTINRMHEDPQFANPFPASETRLDDGTFNFSLSLTYLPPVAKAKAKEGAR